MSIERTLKRKYRAPKFLNGHQCNNSILAPNGDNYSVGYFHSEELLESMVVIKEQDYDKYARKMKKYLKWELIILDDFLLHTITDERVMNL